MKATYVEHMGTDDRVVDAARVSFNKLAENYSPEQNAKLIGYLARHGHWTPFSHPVITIVEKVPIFVARQRFKHMVGFTYNEVSRRYVDDTPEFYVPEVWRGKPINAKQGSSDVEIKLSFEVEWHLNHCADYYQMLLTKGVAPEQARMVLPQAMYTEYMVTGSLAAWARAYKLRIDPHSQKEIQELATQWNDIIQPLFPISWEALTA